MSGQLRSGYIIPNLTYMNIETVCIYNHMAKEFRSEGIHYELGLGNCIDLNNIQTKYCHQINKYEM